MTPLYSRSDLSKWWWFDSIDLYPSLPIVRPPSTKCSPRRWHVLLDQVNARFITRWVAALASFAMLATRLVWGRGWLLLTFLYNIYCWHIVIDYVKAVWQTIGQPDYGFLPHTNNPSTEFKQRLRQDPEFMLWCQFINATITTLLCTCLPYADVEGSMLLFFLLLLLFVCFKLRQYKVRWFCRLTEICFPLFHAWQK